MDGVKLKAPVGLLVLACLALAPAARAAPQRWLPHIGYVYPAGGERGSVVKVVVGGQFLRGATAVRISGEGVTASVAEYYPPRKNLDRDERQLLVSRLAGLIRARVEELKSQGRSVTIPRWLFGGLLRKPRPGREADGQPEAESATLPRDPLLRDLEGMSLRQLFYVATEFLDWNTIRKRQQNAQIAERLLVEITIDGTADPGERELRVVKPQGLSNPLRFRVGTLPEALEQEPNDPGAFPFLPPEEPVKTPVVLNGQVEPGDVDRFRFLARKGQNLVIVTRSRALIPFLADTVPGWCQAVLTLYDASGRELAFADDYRFDPDPVLFFRVPADGQYELEVRDALYRGREDFVYRITLGEVPFVTELFPLGAAAGKEATAGVKGWNLPGDRLPLETAPEGPRVREAVLGANGTISNPLRYAVDALPECAESEPNNYGPARRVSLPVVVNGRVERPGDVDVYEFSGHAGDEIVAEVLARRLLSPLDSLLRLCDASGRVIAWNDDHMIVRDHLHPDMGCLTHHADSYLKARLPADGTYSIAVADAQRHGGAAYAYRLRLSPPRPDFEVLLTPSGLNMPLSRTAELTAHVLRRDGFDGEVEVRLKDAPAGFFLSGNRVPAGRDSIRMTLTAPWRPAGGIVSLEFEARADIGGRTLVRPVVPADEVMQAFLYRHLVPSQECVVALRKGRWNPLPLRPGDGTPVQVPVGGTATVRFRSAWPMGLRNLHLSPVHPAEGAIIDNVRIDRQGVSFGLKLQRAAARVGLADNLIVEAYTDVPTNARDAKSGSRPPKTRRIYLGVLPAIPFVVVEP